MKFVGITTVVLFSTMPLFTMGRLLSSRDEDHQLIVKACFSLNGKNLSGNTVKCYDEDWGLDDYIGSGTTGEDGCATITSKADSWWESPDVYCNVYRKADDQKCFKGATSQQKDDVEILDYMDTEVTLRKKNCPCLDGVPGVWCW